MDPMLIQKQVRDNANELNSFLNELKSWEQDMKRKDKELLENAPDNTVVPPVRSRIKRPKNTKSNRDLSSKIKEVKKIQSCDYSKWDKFDVEKACEEVDYEEKEQDHSDSESDVEATDSDVAQLREQAMYEKELGNEHVKNQRWKEAIACYSNAIKCSPYDAVFYANRALCYLKTKQSKLAETDCTTALQLDKSYVKAYQRRALARVEIGLQDDAKSDFQKVLDLEPNNSAAKSELSKLEKRLSAANPRKKTGLSTSDQKKETRPSPKNQQTETSQSTANQREENISKTVLPKNTSDNLNITVGKVCSESTCRETDDLQRLERTADILRAGGDTGTQVKCSVLRESDEQINPFQKPPHLRSKRPLKSVPVQEVETFADLVRKKVTGNIKDNIQKKIVEIKTETFPELDKLSAAHEKEVSQDKTQELLTGKSSKLQVVNKIPEQPQAQSYKTVELPPVPKTSVQFFLSWKIVKNDNELRYQFLKQITGKELPHIFQESLESKEFSEIISSLASEFVERNEPIYPYLQGLSEVKRFSALVMFMSKAEKNVLKKLLQHCDENGECTKEELAKLMKCYEIN